MGKRVREVLKKVSPTYRATTLTQKKLLDEIRAEKKDINNAANRIENIYWLSFYIVECLNEDDENFHILFDAVTGDFSLLNA